MKILLVSSYLPFPLYSGGQVRLYNLIRELSDKHEITLVCEKRSNQTEDDIKAVEKICKKVITVPRRKQWSLENILKSGSSQNSFLMTGHTHKLMQQKIREELAAEYYDLIHVETYYVIQNLPDVFIPVVLVEHNIEYKVYERYVKRAPAMMRPLLAVDVLKIKHEEQAAWKRAESLVAVSKDDQVVIENNGTKSFLVPNGVNTEQFAFKGVMAEPKQTEKKILFIGDFKWIQNRDSVQFIIKEIWPLIDLRFKNEDLRMNVKLWIVGRSIPDSFKSLTSDPNVLFDEVSSANATQEIFQEASVLLAPIRVGGGTSYKILESMSCGTPVVTMQLSADAIEASDGEEILVGQTASELADKTIKVLQDSVLYEKISTNGRNFVEQNYTWKEIAKRLDEVYTSAVKGTVKT
jgi:glycosyltransferase involved in cell wall biosynthesis